MKALTILPVGFEGAPDVPDALLTGYVFNRTLSGRAALYTVVFPSEDLDALRAYGPVLPVSEDGGKWPELNEALDEGTLAAVNALLVGVGQPAFPPGIVALNALSALVPKYGIGAFDVADPEGG
jgi:hypothetical protein